MVNPGPGLTLGLVIVELHYYGVNPGPGYYGLVIVELHYYGVNPGNEATIIAGFHG